MKWSDRERVLENEVLESMYRTCHRNKNEEIKRVTWNSNRYKMKKIMSE